MNAHLFTATTGSKVCTECGKTRNAKAHKEARAAASQATVTAEDVAEARQDMLPEVEATTDDAEIADALAQLEVEAEALVEEDANANAEAPAKKAAPKKANGTATIWLGWRIANAAVLVGDSSTKAAKSLATKIQDAKPTADLDRTLKLTKEEFEVLDTIAKGFMEPGHTGPEQYSGRALRGRIAAALAKIEATK